MKKRMLTVLLALVMILSVLPFAAMAAEAECDHSAAQFRLESEDADCIHEGAINYFCKECGELVNSVAKPGGFGPHTYGKDSTCDVCGRVCKTHSYGSAETVPATCTEAGTETKTCTECGYKRVKTLKATGHKFTVSVVGRVATCTVDGYSAHKACNKCGEPNEDYKAIEAPGHKIITDKDTAATCTKNGTLEQHCENCEYTNAETREATGHSYVPATGIDPTCTEVGYSDHEKCTACGKQKGCVVIAATGHEYLNGQCKKCGEGAPDYSGTPEPGTPADCLHKSVSSYTTSPDCEEVGYIVRTCDDCHVELSREIEPATGHMSKLVIKNATCTEDGYEREICENCRELISNTILERHGHNYVSGVCTRCGITDSSKYTKDFQDIQIVGGPAY